MSEIRKKLTNLQLSSLINSEKVITEHQQKLEDFQKHHKVLVELIFDAHGVTDQQVSFDAKTAELVVHIPDETDII